MKHQIKCPKCSEIMTGFEYELTNISLAHIATIHPKDYKRINKATGELQAIEDEFSDTKDENSGLWFRWRI